MQNLILFILENIFIKFDIIEKKLYYNINTLFIKNIACIGGTNAKNS